MAPIFSRLAERSADLVRAHRHLFVAFVVVVAALLWTGAGASAWFLRDVATGLPDRQAIQGMGVMSEATTLVDSQGRHAFTIFKEQRIEVPLDRVSPHLVRAIVAIEDQRFYEHGGVDVVRVLGAAWNNVLERRAAQGGSTITQQLARQSFLSSDKTIRRKLKEVVLAARIEREFSKEQILELYLNKVYFGDGLYGVQAASLGYFGKPAADVNVVEAATLAGLVKSPSAYAPTVSPERALARRNVVLQSMKASGVIGADAYAEAVKAPLELTDGLRHEEAYGQYFKEEVRRQLVDRFGWERVYQGGLKVYTTLDLDMQKTAEAEVMRGLEQIEARQARLRGRRAAADPEPLQAALVALDPRTGAVRAMVGGRDFADSSFNRATQAKRQPGSAFKPFVYAAALEQGFSPASVITGLDTPIMTLQGAWVPEDEHVSGGSITMRTALRASSNRAAVQMLQQVGIDDTVRYAEKLGVGDVPRVPSLALGSGEVTLQSMTSAYAAFASEGMVREPHVIERVEGENGETLYTAGLHEHRAVSEATAFLMTSMMADVINSGTAWQARQLGFTLPAAGKTGTTNDYHDAWFVGFTPKLVTGVWVGYDQPRTIMRGGYAAELAVPMWSRFMATATKGDEPDWFSPPQTVTAVKVCRLTGKLPAEGCEHAEVVASDGSRQVRSQVYTEYFVRGTEPIDTCPLHGGQGFWRSLLTAGNSQPSAAPVAVAANTVPASAPEAAAPAVATGGEQAAVPAAVTEEKPRKRGFWSRLFGRGGSDDDKDRDEDKDADSDE